MPRSTPSALLLACLMTLTSAALFSQNWKFIKEKDGIRIYTRSEAGKSVKSFRGITDIRAPMEKVCNLIGNVKNLDWWDKNLKEIKILYYEKNKVAQYYLIYDAPWPVSDRDLCVESIITDDPVTGVRRIMAKPLLNKVPKNPNCVRIEDYWQSWELTPDGKGMVHAVLEGRVNPGGAVPDWIYNMVIADTPLKVMRGAKNLLESK